MPSKIAATAADMPLSYQSFNNYAQATSDKTARHGLHVSLLPEIWALVGLADGQRPCLSVSQANSTCAHTDA